MGVGDWLGEACDTGKKVAGETVDGAAHVAGAGLDMVGLHGAAKSVDGWGTSAADSLGVDIAEKELGDSDDPKELIHGDPAAIREAAGHLSHFPSPGTTTACTPSPRPNEYSRPPFPRTPTRPRSTAASSPSSPTWSAPPPN